jgi:uncharacterized membrane protein
MPSAERSVSINRPAADVFAFVADGANAPEWRSGVVDIKHESGEGVGTVYRQRVRGPMRRRIAADYEITVYDVNKKLEFKAIAGPVRPAGGYRFHEANGKTKVTFWLKGELRGWKRFVLGRSVQKSMDAEMKSLDRLKEVLEAGASAKPAASATKSGSAGSAGSAGSSSSGDASATKSGSAASASPASPTAAKGTAAKAAAAPQTRAAKATAKAAAARTATPRTARRRTKAQ